MLPKIEHIKYERCPDCGAEIHKITIGSRHINGHRYEDVDFECGASFSFIPNFFYGAKNDGIGQSHKCPNTPAGKNEAILNRIDNLLLSAGGGIVAETLRNLKEKIKNETHSHNQ